MKIINKDDCLQALNDIKMYGGINIPLSAFDTFDRLIEEHFSPQFLKFEELHENMWVFDTYIKCAIYITKIENNCINSEYEHFDNPIKHELFCNICGENENQTYFEEERFYPITIPNIGDKNG